MCAEHFGNLHRERAHASRSTINQHLAARLNLSMVAKTLYGCQSRDVYGTGLLERNAVGFRHDTFLARSRVLGKRAAGTTKDPVARFELRDFAADCFNLAGHIYAGVSDWHLEQPRHYAKHARLASQQTPIERIDGSRA